MEGTVIAGAPDGVWRGAALDSRKVAGGELFFALPGEASDGHLFVADALGRGAAAAVVHREVPKPAAGALIRVPDTYAALHALTRAVRRRVPRKLAAITGSIGKTTTKDLLAAMLARRFRGAASPGNLNNLYGFPLSLLGIPDDTEWMVAEMGMSTPGELARISRLGRPDVAVFTNVRPVHLEFFGTLRAIADAKAELFEGLAAEGLVVANADDPEVARICRGRAQRVVWYGLERPVEVRAERVEDAAAGGHGSRFRLLAGGDAAEVELPLHGRYNVANFLAAAACAHALGMAAGEIAAAAAAARPGEMRGVVHRLEGGATVIDDSYNSNPEALARALESAAALPGARRWAVLGEMLELGPEAPAFHARAGAEAARLGFSPVVGVGAAARDLVEGARAAGAEARWLEDAAAAAADAAARLEPKDVVLVKGSRGVGLEAVVRSLVAAGGGD